LVARGVIVLVSRGGIGASIAAHKATNLTESESRSRRMVRFM
jgi:hypothetical protein